MQFGSGLLHMYDHSLSSLAFSDNRDAETQRHTRIDRLVKPRPDETRSIGTGSTPTSRS